MSVCPSFCLSVRPSVCLSVCPSFCLSVLLSACVSVCPSFCLPVCLCVCLSLLSVHPFVCPSVCLSVRLSVCLSVRPSVCLSVCPSVCLSVLLSVRPSVCLSVLLFVHPFVCLSVCPSGLSLEIVNSAAYMGRGLDLRNMESSNACDRPPSSAAATRVFSNSVATACWSLPACRRTLSLRRHTRHIPDWGPVARVLSMMSITQ